MTCREIEDDEALSQYGVDGEPWRVAPREGESDVSVLLGELPPDEAARRVRKGRWIPAGTDGVRYTTAGTLRAAGFDVRYTHTKANKLHASVVLPNDGTWDNEQRAQFDNCFGDPQYVASKESES